MVNRKNTRGLNVFFGNTVCKGMIKRPEGGGGGKYFKGKVLIFVIFPVYGLAFISKNLKCFRPSMGPIIMSSS